MSQYYNFEVGDKVCVVYDGKHSIVKEWGTLVHIPQDTGDSWHIQFLYSDDRGEKRIILAAINPNASSVIRIEKVIVEKAA